MCAIPKDRTVGVYGGVGINTYLLANTLSDRALVESVGGYQLMLANDRDFLCTRVSYNLDLRGPSMTFDVEARGTRPGAGAGIVVLKRLADAVAERDTIHAVIRGAAVNSDGAAKAGYTAPSVDGQVEVIATAVALADVPARSIGLVEAA